MCGRDGAAGRLAYGTVGYEGEEEEEEEEEEAGTGEETRSGGLTLSSPIALLLPGGLVGSTGNGCVVGSVCPTKIMQP